MYLSIYCSKRKWVSDADKRFNFDKKLYPFVDIDTDGDCGEHRGKIPAPSPTDPLLKQILNYSCVAYQKRYSHVDQKPEFERITGDANHDVSFMLASICLVFTFTRRLYWLGFNCPCKRVHQWMCKERKITISLSSFLPCHKATPPSTAVCIYDTCVSEVVFKPKPLICKEVVFIIVVNIIIVI